MTLEAVKEQFCTADKREVLKQMADRLESVWDIDKAADTSAGCGCTKKNQPDKKMR